MRESKYNESNPFIRFSERYDIYMNEPNNICQILRRMVVSGFFTTVITMAFVGVVIIGIALYATNPIVLHLSIPLAMCVLLGGLTLARIPFALTLLALILLIEQIGKLLPDTTRRAFINNCKRFGRFVQKKLCSNKTFSVDTVWYKIATRWDIYDIGIDGRCRLIRRFLATCGLTAVGTLTAIGIFLTPFLMIWLPDDSKNVILILTMFCSFLVYLGAIIVGGVFTWTKTSYYVSTTENVTVTQTKQLAKEWKEAHDNKFCSRIKIVRGQ